MIFSSAYQAHKYYRCQLNNIIYACFKVLGENTFTWQSSCVIVDHSKLHSKSICLSL